ncbi:hypothetical protein [Neotabrizicola shimadae]|uniref:Sulfotransferase family 2 domain-containing protein n=1 Tax=Neotabrizicola shimadae TaxID=2807096 RepID=A0A8G0ZWL2_9RHOB|nr:hypothetical protein [Neotabrizicola shimadae]QYZ70043.1 sulfotransferase family 2 domain-containing protein [Neotabrizicola shimadae]
MSFGDLKRMSLADFISEFTEPSALWFFQHIPKTAGSSFSAELRSIASPYRNIHASYGDDGSMKAGSLEEALSNFCSDPELPSYRSASGHLKCELLEPLRTSIPRLRVTSILRAPENRVISDYRYQRTEMHPPHLRFREQFPTLESYIDHPMSQNTMAKFIAGRDCTAESLIRAVEEDMAFVGLLEMYPMSFGIIFQLMGHPNKFPSEHQRKTPNTADTSVDLTQDILRKIKDKNEKDVFMFDHVRSILTAHRDEWRSIVGASQKPIHISDSMAS